MKSKNIEYEKISGYIDFLIWYYSKSLTNYPDKPSYSCKSVITKKERPFLISFAYIMILTSPFWLFLNINFNYIFIVLEIICSFIILFLCDFSLIIYSYRYLFYRNRKKTINNNLISDYYFIGKSEICPIINYSKKYKRKNVVSKITSLLFILEHNGSIKKIKITRKKIYINRKCILNTPSRKESEIQKNIVDYL